MDNMIRPLVVMVTLLVTITVGYGQEAQRIDPLFPEQPEGLVWLEAEDAVTTNFSNEATLDYGSSGYRLLQLNKEGQSKSVPFYAEYTFEVEESGLWQLWLGGTPPGPESDLLASFVSPFKMILDDGEPIPVYREQVAVNERYSTNNYWFVLKEPIRIEAGIHTLRFEIRETRRYDSRFFFYLDALFFIKEDAPLRTARIETMVVPEHFPKDMDNRKIDYPFQSIPQYEYLIQTSPKNKENYLLLAQVYSLIGDHGSAIKTLSRGRIVAGEDLRFALLSAKSRIWSGEIDEGLRLYREYLSSPEADQSVWAEAAKISAWLMKYRESESLYLEAISLYPDDINLLVNYALTLLWQGRVKEGEQHLTDLWNTLKDAPDQISRLGSVYEISGYPDKAAKSYIDGMVLYPERLELYLRLYGVYEKTNRSAEAREVLQTVISRFAPSQKLSDILAAREAQSGLKLAALERYRSRLQENPDDLELRQELVRAYYWNGMLQEALSEGNNILANKMFNILKELDSDLLESYRYLDLLQLYRNPIGAVNAEAFQRSAKLKRAQETLKKAETQNTKALAGKDAKRKDKAALDLSSAQEALAQETAAAQDFVAWAEGLFPKIAELAQESVQEAEQTTPDAETLEKLKPWVWNADADIGFLRALSDNPLGDFSLERLLTVEGRPTPELIPEPQLQEAKALRLQTLLWTTGSTGEADFDSDTYYPYGYEIAEASLDLVRDDPLPVLYGQETLQASADTLPLLETVSTQGLESAALLQTAIKNLQARIRTRLRIRMYQYDSETTQDRRELSDVYIRLDRNAEAIRLLKRVLVAAPSDAASLFTLGRAYEMDGDWSSAMEMYRSVYELNPRFESAVASYNRLARLHGKTLETSVLVSVDAQRTNDTTRLAYAVPINGILDVQASYTLENLKIHAPQGGSLPESVQLQTVDIRVPITLSSLGLQIYGMAGGTIQNKLRKLLPPGVNNFSPEKAAEYIVTAPRLGGGAAWKKGIFALNGTYSFNQVGETFFSDRFVHYEHSAGVSGSAYYEAPFRNWGRILSAQASFGGSSRFSPYFPNLENLITRADGEIHVGNLAVSKPWTLLDVGGFLSWQDSQKTTIKDYYSPDDLLILKGGPTLSSRFALGKGWTMTATARYWPGYYSPQQKGRFMWDALGRVDFVKNEIHLYASFDGSRTEPLGPEPAYWSMAAGVGARIILADYIIP